MKTATLLPVKVDPNILNETEKVLYPGETLSDFIKTAMKAEIIRRQNQQTFIAKGLTSQASALKTQIYFDASDVLDELDKMYESKKRQTLDSKN